MSLIEPVEVAGRAVARLGPVIGGERHARLVEAADEFRERLGGRTIWNVSSTAVGGGVAEMLHVLVGYALDLAIPVRWVVITGDAEFFVITKRLHNQIHGEAAGGPLSASDADHYVQMLAANAAELLEQITPGDLVLLHDPQTAGLAAALASAGAAVAWRCHVGVDWENDATRAVITQKSLAEGFGLTVAEGMWKARPVVGSAVGGIIDQITPGTGILLPDPRDGASFGTAVRWLLNDPDQAAQMGRAAQAHIRKNYVGDLHLLRYERLFSTLISEG